MKPSKTRTSKRNSACLTLLLAFGLCVFCPPSRGQVPNNILLRVLLIEIGDKAGTGFTIDVDGRQYLVTAKHLVSGLHRQGTIRLHSIEGWTTSQVKVFRCEDPIDIAVLIPDKQLTVNFPLEPTLAGMQLGQDVYFLGFPYGQLYSDVKFKNVDGYLSFPFVKKAAWSASAQASSGTVLFLDGHNNRGFSGGPIVFRDFAASGYIVKVAGVVSGYEPNFEYVLEPKKIQPNEDLSNVEPWRIVTLRDGQKVRLEDTKQMVDTNSGIVKGYAIASAVELIRKHPEGPEITGGQPQPASPR